MRNKTFERNEYGSYDEGQAGRGQKKLESNGGFVLFFYCMIHTHIGAFVIFRLFRGHPTGVVLVFGVNGSDHILSVRPVGIGAVRGDRRWHQCNKICPAMLFREHVLGQAVDVLQCLLP